MIKTRKVNRVLLPIHSIHSSSIQPLHFLLYPSILTCLIYHTNQLAFVFHHLQALHNLIHQPHHLFSLLCHTITLQ